MSEENAKSQKLGTSHFRLDHQLEIAVPCLAAWHIQIYKHTSQISQQQGTAKQNTLIQLPLLLLFFNSSVNSLVQDIL